MTSEQPKLRCYFMLSGEPTVGSRVEMELTLPSVLNGSAENKLHCEGTIVAVHQAADSGKTGVRCRFERMSLDPA